MKVFLVNFHYLVDFYYSCKMSMKTSFPVSLRLRGEFVYMAERKEEDDSQTY